MPSFKFIELPVDTVDRLVEALERISNFLIQEIMKGKHPSNKICKIWIAKYNQYKEVLIVLDNKEWINWCKKKKYQVDHVAEDYWK